MTALLKCIFFSLGLSFPICKMQSCATWLIRAFLALISSGYSYLDVRVCLVVQSCLTLCDPINCSSPGSSVLGIFQVGILKQFAISSSRGSSQPKDGTCISCIDSWILYHWATCDTRKTIQMWAGGRIFRKEVTNLLLAGVQGQGWG